MKKQLFTALICLFAFTGFSQIQFGVGGSYYNDFGVQARGVLDAGEKINVSPKATYFFTDGGTVIFIDGDVHYDVAQIEDNNIYAIGGLMLGYFNSDFGGSQTELGINLGAGIEVGKIYGEVKWTNLLCDFCGDDIGIHVGYYFN